MLIISAMTLSVFAGCSKKADAPQAEAAAAEEPAAEEVAAEEPAAEAAETEAEPAEAAAAEEPAAEEVVEEVVEEAPVEIVDFEYTGEDPYFAPIWNYLKENVGVYYGEADLSLPAFDIFREDDSDPEDIKVWGQFWLFNYNLRGTTLMTQSGGAYPGLMHLKAAGDSFEVTAFDQVEDGTNYGISAQKIFGVDNELLEAFRHSSDNFNDCLLNSILMYSENSGIEIKAFQDFGWDPVQCVFGDEFVVEYPEIAGNWVSEDGNFEMEIQDPVGGSTYDVTINDATEGAVYRVFGQYEQSTKTLYYWNGWMTKGTEETQDEDGALAVLEDGTILWTKGEEEISFSRAPEVTAEAPADEKAEPVTEAATLHAFAGAFTPDISLQEAKQIALDNAGLKESDVIFVRTELELDDGYWKYEVEFYNDNKEYDYDIDATTGQIISFDQDAEFYAPPVRPAAQAQELTDQEALAVALQHAGVSQSDISRARIKRDFDDGFWKYEIEFRVGWTEYDYEIDAATGRVMSFDIGD